MTLGGLGPSTVLVVPFPSHCPSDRWYFDVGLYLGTSPLLLLLLLRLRVARERASIPTRGSRRRSGHE